MSLMITEYVAENFKRVKAMRVRPKGRRLIPITGDNEQGKSSLLDGIFATFGDGRNN